jgi:hypothetical protein
VTLLDGADNADGDKTAMSDGDVAWSRGGQINVLDRTDVGGAPIVIDAGSSVLDLALSGPNAGYTTAQTTAGRKVFAVHTGAIGSTVFSSATSEFGRVFTGRGVGFPVFAGRTTADFGAHARPAGATSVGSAVVLFGRAAPLGIDASAGRVVSVLPDGQNSPAQQQRISSDAANAHVVSSHPSRLVSHSLDSAPPAASGGHSGYLTRRTNDSCALVVLDGTTVVATYPAPVTCYHVTLSGGLALVSYTSRFIDDTHRNPPGSLLIDLDTGGRTIEPETEALSGDQLAYFAHGDVVVKNLASGVTTTVAIGVVNADALGRGPGAGPAVAGRPLADVVDQRLDQQPDERRAGGRRPDDRHRRDSCRDDDAPRSGRERRGRRSRGRCGDLDRPSDPRCPPRHPHRQRAERLGRRDGSPVRRPASVPGADRRVRRLGRH